MISDSRIEAHRRAMERLGKRRTAPAPTPAVLIGPTSIEPTALVAPTTPARQRFRIISDEGLEHMEAPSPLVEGVLCTDSLAALVAPSGSLKSFVALDIVCSVASGHPWHGRPVKQGPVVYIAAEGAYGMRARTRAWKRLHHVHGPIGEGVYFVTEPAYLNDPADVTALIVRLTTDVPAPGPVLIVVDTLARCFRGNENSTEDAGAFISGCDRLRQMFDATILLVHHTGWSAERSRGSSAIPAALDTEVTLARDGDRVTLKCTKQKDAEPFADITLEAYRVEESLALRAVVPNEGALTKNERACLGALHEQSNEQGVAFGAWMEAANLTSRGSFDNARKALMARGYARAVLRKYHITETGAFALTVQKSNAVQNAVQTPLAQEVQRSPVSIHGELVLSHDPEAA